MRWLQCLLLFAWTTNISSQDHEIKKRETPENEKKVVCYYTNWSVYRPGTAKFTPQNINPYLCTHLIYAFGGLDRENGLRPYDKYQDIEQGGYAKFTGLKTFNKNLKTLLAIGGWNEGSARFSPLVADEDRRKEFIKNVVKFLRINHFDGLDLDWEYPAFRDGGKPKDRENYASLVQELREEFDRESSKTGRPRLLLTMAVPAGIEYINKGYDVVKLNKYLDFMNILSYDYHSAFEPAVNHHSPLYPLEEESEYNFDAQLSIDYTVKHYLKSGADREKLVLGIPTYGRSYTLFNKDSNQLGAPADGPGEQGEATREKGYLAYYEICSGIKENDSWKVEQPKPEAMGPYAYSGNQWVGYDDEEIVKLKAQYVNEKGLGGIMFWSIDNDDFRGTCHSRAYPLIEAGKEALFGAAGPSNNLISSSEKKVTQVSTSTRRPKPRPKPVPRTTTTTTKTPTNPLTTPEPPTTPDPGSDFKCKDEGFFPHPRDCKKYFWCLDSGPSNLGIVAHQFTCPSGLFFNKAADSCDYTRNVLCNKKSSATEKSTSATTKVTVTTAKASGSRYTTSTTTTTTTTEAPVEEEEYEDSAEEDPKAIKQLISLIKKLGGVAELEKQLNLDDAGQTLESTTPTISRNLYNKVLNSATPRYQSRFRNGPGQQNEGLKPDLTAASRKEKPQYVTIRREKPSTEAPIDSDDEETEVESQNPKYKTIERVKNAEDSSQEDIPQEDVQTPKYASIFRNRAPPSKDVKGTSPKYVTLQRNRAPQPAVSPVEEEVEEEFVPQVVTPKYVTLRRQKPQLLDPESDDQEVRDKVTKETKVEDIPVTEVTETANTVRPKVKVSSPSNHTLMKVIIITPEPVALAQTTPSVDASTSTRVVTTVVEAATERQIVPVNKLEYFLAKHASVNRNLPITSEIIHNDVQKLDAEIINKLKKPLPSYSKQKINETKVFKAPEENFGPNLKGRFGSPSNRSRVQVNSSSPALNATVFSLTTLSPVQKKQFNSTNLNNYIKRRQNSRFLSLNSSTTTETTAPVVGKKFVPTRARGFKVSLSINDVTAEDQSSESSSTSPDVTPVSRFRPQIRRKTSPITPSSTTPVEPKKRRVLLRGKPNNPENVHFTTFDQESATTSQYSTLATSSTRLHNLQTSDSNPQQEIIKSSVKEEETDINEDKRSLEVDEKNNVLKEGVTTEILKTQTEPYFPEKTTPSTLRIIYEDTARPNNVVYEITTHRPHQRGKIRAQDYLSQLSDELGTELEENSSDETLKTNDQSSRGSRNQIHNKENPGNPKVFKVTKLKRLEPSKTDNHAASSHHTNGLKNLDKSVEEEKGINTSEKSKINRGSVRAYHLLQSDKNINEEYIQATTNRGNRVISSHRFSQAFTATKKPYTQLSRDYSFEESKIDNVVSSETLKPRQNKEDPKKIVTLRGVIRYSEDGEVMDKSNESKQELRQKPQRTRGNVIHAEYFENQKFQPTTANTRGNIYRGSMKAFQPNNIILSDLNNGQLIHLQAPLLAHSLLADEKFFEDHQSILTESEDDSPFLIQSREISSVHYEMQGIEKQSKGNSGDKIGGSRPVSKSNQEISPTRGRTQFRRPNSSILRSRSTVKPTTDTPVTEATTKPVNKLFRRRKIRPEITSVATTPISEEPVDNVEATTSRGRKIEFTRRVNKVNLVPQAAALQYSNVSLDYDDTKADGGSVSNRIGSLEEGTSKVEKISDLADVAVVAIHNLATVVPGIVSPKTSIEQVPVRQIIPTQTPIVVAPIKKYNYRNNVKPYIHSTTSSPGATQFRVREPLFDYDTEYYAEPVDVPLSGKVRIHNDGYIECLDIGNFPHPFSCKKFISCAKMENDHLLGWEYTCPRGLSFDPIGGMCNWSAGLGCKE